MVQSEAGVTAGIELKGLMQPGQEFDRLALIAYSNEAKVVFGLTAMDATGRHPAQPVSFTWVA
eukprot:1418221-Amphidinium_carterae.2